MDQQKVERFLTEFVAWATGRSDIMVVLLVGSFARGTATDTSDIDLIVIADDPNLYLKNADWVRVFGKVVREEIEDYGKLISLRVHYEDGREVEYGITDENWPRDEGAQEVMSGGMRVLLDKSVALCPAMIRLLSGSGR
jgi:predicted nucleotidyltransferase